MQYLHKFPTDVPFQVLKKFEVIRALTVSPKILFLDEPSAGLTNPELVEMSNFIKNRLPANSSLILVEHREGNDEASYLKNFQIRAGDNHPDCRLISCLNFKMFLYPMGLLLQ